MKNFKFYTIAALALAMGMTSCSSDNNGVEVENGEKTVIEVAFNFPKEVTAKATTGDVNAIDAEAEIKTVNVFIFNGSGTLVGQKALVAGDFTATVGGVNADKYVSSVAIPTTTGLKSILIGVNLPASTVTAVQGMSLTEMQTKAITMTSAESTTIGNGLPMFSTVAVTQTVVKDDTQAANKFEVTVQRFVSKVVVEKSATMTVGGVAGTLGAIEFSISNNNTKAFMIQTADKKDPNWADASYVAGDFASAPAASYVAIYDRALGTPAIGAYNAKYALENSSEKKRKKEITRATVRAQFRPDLVCTWNGTILTENIANGAAPGTTYWTVTPSLGQSTKFFYDQTQATAYATANTVSPVEYADGYNYWSIFLNEKSVSNQWDNLRNNFFACTITKIITPGNPTDAPTDPETTPSEATNIYATVNIQNWDAPILSDHELDKW